MSNPNELALVAEPRYRAATEEAFRLRLKADLGKLGFKTYHQHRSDRSDEGWPDMVALRVNFLTLPDRAIFMELKVGSRRCTPAQMDCLLKLHAFWDEVYIVRDRDLQLFYALLCGDTEPLDSPLHVSNIAYRPEPPAPELGAWRAYLGGRIGGRVRAR